MLIILFGGPGVGKGTIAQRLQENGIGKQVSTGDLFRREIAANTEVGRTARNYIDIGQLVPDDITRKLIEGEIAKAENIILDGYPRTTRQIEDLNELLASHSKSVSLVINVVAGEKEVINRITSRVICSECHAIYNEKHRPPKQAGKCDKCGGSVVHRSDDNEQTVRARLAEYHKKTSHLLSYYRTNVSNRFIEINSSDCNVVEKVKQALKLQEL